MKTRCAPAPEDQAGPVTRIEVSFAIPVNVTRDQERRLMSLINEIVEHPSNQLTDGVHWVSGYGGKMLWREPEEPDVDMSVMAIETSAREFVTDNERARVLSKRNR